MPLMIGESVYGSFKEGENKKVAAAPGSRMPNGSELADLQVNNMAYDLAMTMPDCLAKTMESVRKKKLEHWQKTVKLTVHG